MSHVRIRVRGSYQVFFHTSDFYSFCGLGFGVQGLGFSVQGIGVKLSVEDFKLMNCL